MFTALMMIMFYLLDVAILFIRLTAIGGYSYRFNRDIMPRRAQRAKVAKIGVALEGETGGLVMMV